MSASSVRPPDPIALLGRRGIVDPAVRHAILEVPRTSFIAVESAADGWADHPLPDGLGGTTLAPGALAALLQALASPPEARVLVVGTSAYAAAVLANLSIEVHTVEPDLDLARASVERLRALEILNAKVHHGDPAHGWAGAAPFDRVLVASPTSQVPPALKEQLAVGGVLIALLGPDRIHPRIVRVTRPREDRFDEQVVGTVELASRIGDVLIALHAIDRTRVEAVAPRARAAGRRLGEVLLEEGAIHEEDLYRALAAQRGFAFGHVESLIRNASLEVSRSVSRAFLERHRALPLRRERDHVIVATCEPDAALGDLAKALGAHLEIYLVTPTDYRRIWAALELHAQTPIPVAAGGGSEDGAADLLTRLDLDAHRIALFDTLLLEAVGERASDVHLERYGERVRVRLRVDGDLRDLTRIPMSVDDLLGVVNVVKVAGGLDIAERRLPQGGRARRRAGGKSFDLRIQTQPTLYGEHVVIRLLPQNQRLLTIEDLGFSPDIAAAYRRLLESPSGLVLVVGPTGSGKSTTLYAGLQILARDETRKVLTIEDPIEYSLDGVQQSQAKPEIGFGFADAMRAFVREDPDVILVGEIRDAETALEAIRASQTGHIVLSTLHCNDAPDAVQRLVDLGMHPSSIASELIAVIAQRLAKRVCTSCRREVEPEPHLVKEIFPRGIPAGFRCYRGAGCERCGGHGTHGRIGVVELMRTGPAIRRAIAKRLPLDELRAVALEEGLAPMRGAALDLVVRGQIPLSELPWVLPAERLGEEVGVLRPLEES